MTNAIWSTTILPYCDRAELYRQIDRRRPWHDPVNHPHFATVIPYYVLPTLTNDQRLTPDGYAIACYAANELVIGGGPPVRFADITDGSSVTLLAGEARGNFKPWGHPANWRDARLGINKSVDGFGGPWKGGAHVLLVDGTVRFISENIDPQVLHALSSPAGEDRVDEF